MLLITITAFVNMTLGFVLGTYFEWREHREHCGCKVCWRWKVRRKLRESDKKRGLD